MSYCEKLRLNSLFCEFEKLKENRCGSLLLNFFSFSNFRALWRGTDSLRASSTFVRYREKKTRERHARGDAKAGAGERPSSAPRGFALARAACFALPNRRACSQAQEQMKMSNLLEKGLPYLSSPLVWCVCLRGGGGGLVEDRCIQLISAFLYREV